MVAQTVPNKAEKYTAPALEKGLDVLEYLAETDDGRSLMEISRGLERTRSEIFRMVVVLERRGLIKKSGAQEKYELTDKLFRLGLKRPSRQQLMEVAIQQMEDFSRNTSQSCHLTIESEGDIVVIMRAESPESFGVAVRVGHRRSLVGSPSGHCMLAYKTSDKIEQAFEVHVRNEGRWKREELDESLQLIRDQGICRMQNGFVKGVVGLAAPIVDAQSKTCLAAVSSPYALLEQSTNNSLRDVGDALIDCSRRISDIYNG